MCVISAMVSTQQSLLVPLLAEEVIACHGLLQHTLMQTTGMISQKLDVNNNLSAWEKKEDIEKQKGLLVIRWFSLNMIISDLVFLV